MEVRDIVQETGIKTIPKKKKCKKAKWLSEEALQIAVNIREVKGKGKKERYTHLNSEFQRIARRDKKAFFSDQCKEIEENNRMGKTRDLLKKIRDTKGIFHVKMGSIKDRTGMDLTEAEVECFYEDLQDLLKLTPKKDVLFIIGDWNAKVGSQEILGVTSKFGLGIQNESGQRLIEFCQEDALVIANTLLQQHKRGLYTWTSPRWSTRKSD